MGELGYLAYLATRLPPTTLATAVKRRTARRIRLAFAGVIARDSPSDLALLSAMGARTVSDLAAAMGQRQIDTWASPQRMAEIRHLSQRVPGLVERVSARAQAIRLRHLPVFGRSIEVRGLASWTRDPVTHASWPLPAVRERRRLVSDPKRVWALGRMDWAVALAQDAWLGDPPTRSECIRAFEDMATELLDAAPCGQGIQWATAMEVSLRGANLATALTMLAGFDAVAGSTRLRLLRSLWEHAAFTHEHLEDQGAVPNNHLVAGLSGLLQIALLFPELPDSTRWLKTAVGGLREQVQAQILDDGMGFEGSVAYHRLLLELLVSAWCVSGEARELLGSEVESALVRMFESTRTYLSSTGEAPGVGDDDSGRGMALTERLDRNHAYLASLGASLFGRSSLRIPDAPFPDEAVWLTGLHGHRRFVHLRPAASTPARALRSFGLAALEVQGRQLTLACCGNGQRGVGGHGHNDKLSIELRVGDRPIVVDCGTATYAEPEVRDRFRGTAMHSTVQVDGQEQSPWAVDRVFALPDLAHARIEVCHARPGGAVAEGTHHGYLRSPLGVLHRRRAELIEAADAALIIDDLLGAAPEGDLRVHRVTSRFHLADRQARIRSLSRAERSRLRGMEDSLRGSESGNEGAHPFNWAFDRAVELGPPEAPTALWIMAGPPGGEVALEPSELSPGYDQRLPTLCIEAEWMATWPLRIAAAFLFLDVDPSASAPRSH